jgi:hypothetical protein
VDFLPTPGSEDDKVNNMVPSLSLLDERRSKERSGIDRGGPEQEEEPRDMR